MTETTRQKPSRSVIARRTLALGTTIATAALGTGAIAGSDLPMATNADQSLFHFVQDSTADVTPLAGGEGEGGEGEGSTPVDPNVALLRDLGFIEGHLRAGLALYQAGDLSAAKTHMGHPIEEKYDAVAGPMTERGQGQLRDQLVGLAQAAEAEAPFAQILPLFEAVQATIDEVRGGMPVQQQVMALSALTRIAADEYSVAVAGETMSHLHEYQDSWGFLRVVEMQVAIMSASEDVSVAAAATKIMGYIEATNPAFGDIQGQGEFEMRPSLIYGAAARIELTAFGLR